MCLHIAATVSELLNSSLLSFDGGASLLLSAGPEERAVFSVPAENSSSSFAQQKVFVNKKTPARITARVFFVNIALRFCIILVFIGSQSIKNG
jgi:hypothetical protein